MKKIEMHIEAVTSMNVQVLAMIILAVHPERDYQSSLKLPIKVGSGDALMLCNQLGKQNMRPTTHTLFSHILDELGAHIESVCISKVEKSLFFADISLKDNEGNIHVIDARPSDALSLAITAQCPIYCTEEVLLKAGMPDFRDIKDTVESDQALSDLVDQDLENEALEDEKLESHNIQHELESKINLMNKLNNIKADAISNFVDHFDDEPNENLNSSEDEDSDDDLNKNTSSQ